MSDDLKATEGVERPAPGKAPTAFRIWRAGENPTTKGRTLFTETSGRLLLAAQAEGGVRYPFDCEHASLAPEAPPEAKRAMGWHSLEVRNGELWAVNCEWTELARSGLEQDPPEWKYFSPVYDVDPVTREVLAYVNCALTNTPATHNVVELASRTTKIAASRKEPTMSDTTETEQQRWLDEKMGIKRGSLGVRLEGNRLILGVLSPKEARRMLDRVSASAVSRRSSAEVCEELDRKMGIKTGNDGVRLVGNRLELGVVTPEEARKRLAANRAKAEKAGYR